MTENRPSAPSWGRAKRGIAGGLLVAVVATLTPVFPERAEAWTPEPTPLDLVVAVDESASLTAEDVRGEIEAAATIAQSGLNPRTRVTVLGFGSANGSGQAAVTQYCRPTVVATVGQLQYLSDCVKKLHRRGEGEGNDTDHVAAVSEALRVLRSGSPSNSLKTVFLLTDGRMDVSNSPSYGSGDRNAEARRRLGDQLQTARREGVRIWSLGFGPKVDQGSLNRFVEGGARRGCDRRAESLPWARRVRDAQVARSLVEAYAAASCFRVGPLSESNLRPGGTVELPLDIPGIAAEATLTVAKGDRRIRVEFVAPDGRPAPAGGSQGRSVFTRSGTDGTVEALRVTEPLDGKWRIRLTAPDGVARLPVSATAMYQGVIRSRIVADPSVVHTGEQVTARLSPVTRRGYVQDPKELQGLSFTVTATGEGLGGGRRVTVRDDGRSPDDAPGDGSYAGTFTAPGTPGRVTLTGRIEGAGLRSDGNPTATINITVRPPGIQDAEPPGRLERHLWRILIGVAVVALLLAVLWLKRYSHRIRTDVRNLRVVLRHNDEQAGRELRPPRGAWSDEFRFVIRETEWQGPHLDHPHPGEEALAARRTRNGQVTVRRPDDTEFQADLGAESKPVADGLRLVFRDAHALDVDRAPKPPPPPGKPDPPDNWL